MPVFAKVSSLEMRIVLKSLKNILTAMHEQLLTFD